MDLLQILASFFLKEGFYLFKDVSETVKAQIHIKIASLLQSILSKNPDFQKRIDEKNKAEIVQELTKLIQKDSEVNIQIREFGTYLKTQMQVQKIHNQSPNSGIQNVGSGGISVGGSYVGPNSVGGDKVILGDNSKNVKVEGKDHVVATDTAKINKVSGSKNIQATDNARVNSVNGEKNVIVNGNNNKLSIKHIYHEAKTIDERIVLETYSDVIISNKRFIFQSTSGMCNIFFKNIFSVVIINVQVFNRRVSIFKNIHTLVSIALIVLGAMEYGNDGKGYLIAGVIIGMILFFYSPYESRKIISINGGGDNFSYSHMNSEKMESVYMALVKEISKV